MLVSDSVIGPSDGSVVWAGEQTSLFYHGWSYTHIDALSHLAYHGRGYNNAPSAHAPPAGQTRNSVAAMRDGILARGVLIDLPVLKGVPYIAPGGAITAADFEAWEERSGLRVRPGGAEVTRPPRPSSIVAPDRLSPRLRFDAGQPVRRASAGVGAGQLPIQCCSRHFGSWPDTNRPKSPQKRTASCKLPHRLGTLAAGRWVGRRRWDPASAAGR
jgi:hypothetical protein